MQRRGPEIPGFGPSSEPPAAGEHVRRSKSRAVGGSSREIAARDAAVERTRSIIGGEGEEGRCPWIPVGLLLWFVKARSFIHSVITTACYG